MGFGANDLGFSSSSAQSFIKPVIFFLTARCFLGSIVFILSVNKGYLVSYRQVRDGEWHINTLNCSASSAWLVSISQWNNALECAHRIQRTGATFLWLTVLVLEL